MYALEALVASVVAAAPPRRPRPGDLSWQQVYDRLGTRLPADYVALTARHGAALLGCRQWLGLCDPLDPGRPSGLLACATDAGDAYRYLRDGGGFPEDFPRAVWPEPDGFLCCGASRDGDYIGWLTVGRPEQWPVMVWPGHTDGDIVIDLPLTEVLVRWLDGKLSVAGLPRCREDHDHDANRFMVW